MVKLVLGECADPVRKSLDGHLAPRAGASGPGRRGMATWRRHCGPKGKVENMKDQAVG